MEDDKRTTSHLGAILAAIVALSSLSVLTADRIADALDAVGAGGAEPASYDTAAPLMAAADVTRGRKSSAGRDDLPVREAAGADTAALTLASPATRTLRTAASR